MCLRQLCVSGSLSKFRSMIEDEDIKKLLDSIQSGRKEQQGAEERAAEEQAAEEQAAEERGIGKEESLTHAETADQQKVQFLFVGNKAGVNNQDKERIRQIMEEASKDSEFYHRQNAKHQKLMERVEVMKKEIEVVKSSPSKLLQIQKAILEKQEKLEQQRIVNRVWVHFDFDMFFVACEIRDNPSLKDKPVAVVQLPALSHSMRARRSLLGRSLRGRLCALLFAWPSLCGRLRLAVFARCSLCAALCVAVFARA